MNRLASVPGVVLNDVQSIGVEGHKPAILFAARRRPVDLVPDLGADRPAPRIPGLTGTFVLEPSIKYDLSYRNVTQ